ncbi:MAG: ABC transporter substrate-binding protein [Rhizobiaceae bacterium]
MNGFSMSRRALALACGTTFLALSGAPAFAQALEGTIKLDSLLSLTGAAAFAGVSSQEGMDFAVEEINSSGYLGSAKLAVNYVDVALSTDQATAAVRGFIDGGAVAVVGLTLGNHALAVAPLAQRAQMPLIAVNTGGLTALTQAGDHVYQVDVAQFRYAGKMADALKDLGVKTTAVLFNDDVPAIRDLWNTYNSTELPRVGIKTEPVINAVSTATDHSAAITTMLAANPDAIGVVTRAGSPTVIAQLRQLGYKGVIWGQAGLAGGVAVNAAPATEGVLFTANAAAGSPYPTMEKFFSGYQQKTGKVGFAFAAQGYDAVWAVARALKTSGCASRECVQKGLSELMKTGYEGALGAVTFQDRNAIGPGAVVRIKNGKEEFVK